MTNDSDIWIPTPAELEAEASEQQEEASHARRSRRRSGILNLAPHVGGKETPGSGDAGRSRS